MERICCQFSGGFLGLLRSLSANRQFLVVLDNASSAEQVTEILLSSPRSAMLVTSNRKLTTISGTLCVDLGLMSAEEALNMVIGLIERQRVDRELEAAKSLIKLCGHLPLALRICAARLSAHPERSLAAECAILLGARERLNALRIDNLDAAASISLSYGQLDDMQQRQFRLLGALPTHHSSVGTLTALWQVDPFAATHRLDEFHELRLVEKTGTNDFTCTLWCTASLSTAWPRKTRHRYELPPCFGFCSGTLA